MDKKIVVKNTRRSGRRTPMVRETFKKSLETQNSGVEPQQEFVGSSLQTEENPIPLSDSQQEFTDSPLQTEELQNNAKPQEIKISEPEPEAAESKPESTEPEVVEPETDAEEPESENPKTALPSHEPEKDAEANNENLQDKELIFSLDIGTHSVIGIVGYKEDEDFVVIDSEMRKHNHRCMVDGQIQDINMVSIVIKDVKAALEQRNNIVLKDVSIAAAGRTLITRSGLSERKTQYDIPISRDLISSMELEAVENALSGIDTTAANTDFYCVGHSVVLQTLDNYPLSNLEGHKGENIKIEIIAAFLPLTVVDSLYAAMSICNLTVKTLTLEPIAAINALIPSELRMLNLALIDIGAGTSDIAISKDGSVVSYAMATIAGDEITEAIINKFLVDFSTAEKMKLSLAKSSETISFTDILGFSYDKTYDEVLSAVAPSLSQLVSTVCDKIVEINKTAPTAVFLAGGGSLIPNITEKVASKLEMNPNRVAIKSNSFLKNVRGKTDMLDNPQFVTPIGIALTAIMQDGFDLYFVTLNGEKIRIFNGKEITVNDVLSQAGIQSKQLIGLTGKSIVYELNGKKITQYGGMSIHGKILVNGEEKSIRAKVKAGDKIDVTLAENGKDADTKIEYLIDLEDKGEASIGVSRVPLSLSFTVNGEEKDRNYTVKNYDVINTSQIITLADAINYLHISPEENDFFLKTRKLGLGYILRKDDEITCKPKSPKISGETPDEKAKAEINGDSSSKTKPDAEEKHDNLTESSEDFPEIKVTEKTKTIEIFVNGSAFELPYHSNGTPPIFADATALANIDLKHPQGDLVIKLNGRSSNYTDFLKSGDKVEIYWTEGKR